MRMPKFEDIFPHFLHRPFHPDEAPNRKTIEHLVTCIYANAGTVPTTLGGGIYGHLGAIMPPADYAQLPGSQPWVEPVHPGPNPNTPPHLNDAQRAEHLRVYNAACYAAELKAHTMNALKQGAIKASISSIKR